MKNTIAILLLFISIKGFCQLKGTITDEKNKPLENVNVLLLKAIDSSLVKGTVTDKNGTFIFQGLKYDDYLFQFSKIGYRTLYSIKHTIASDKAIQIEPVILLPEVKSLKEVVLTTRRPFIEQKLDRMIVNIENSIISTGNNGLEVLEKLPGVSVQPNGSISLKGRGVQIHIDGRPTNMSADDLANFLRSLTATQIERIEIISNPSSRYDAAGTGGIINIRMKKDLKIGFNGTASLGINYGKYAKYNAGISANYRDSKKNLFGSYAANERRNLTNSISDKNFRDAGSVYARFVQKGKVVDHTTSQNLRAGADFFLNNNTTLGFLGNVVNTKLQPRSDSKTIMENGNRTVDSLLFTTSNNRSKWNIVTGNINFRHRLDTAGKEITIDLEHSSYNRDNQQLFINTQTDANENLKRQPDTLSGITPAILKISSFKADYLHPLKNDAKIEAGVKASFVQNDNDLLFYNQWGIGPVVNKGLSNHFIYTERINAVYFNYSKEREKWNYQFGLRGEQTITKGEQITTNTRLPPRNYFQIFPSVFLNYRPAEKHQIGLSYSRRIGRPSYSIVNPFRVFRDQFTYSEGNPFIQPQLSNSIELNYVFNNNIILGVSYGNTNNSMTFVVKQDNSTKTTVETYDNLANLKDGGITLSANLKIAKWWNSNNFFGVFYNHFEGVYGNEVVNNSGAIFNISINHSITLPKNYTIEFGGFYLSRQPQGILTISPQSNFNIGLQKSFLEKRGTLRISISDLFHAQQWEKVTRFSNVDASLKNTWDSRQIRVGLSWKFGKQTVPAEKRRKSAAEEEKNRIQID